MLAASACRLPGWRRAVPLGALLAVFLGCAVSYSLAVPLWEAADEPEHFQYVIYLVERHAIPFQLPTIQTDGNNEGKQPPLYYALALPFVAGVDLSDADRIRLNPHAGWIGLADGRYAAVHTLDEGWPFHGVFLGAHRVRLLSALLGAATVALTYGIAYCCTGRRGTAFAAAAFVAFLPGFLFASATINNDALANTLGAALLYLVVRDKAPHAYGTALAFGVASCLALLAKLDTALLVVLGGAAIVGGAGAGRRGRTLLLTAAPLLPALGFWAWRVANGERRLAGRLIGWPPRLPGSGSPLGWSLPWHYASRVWTSFVGVFGWQSIPLPTPVYAAYGAALALALGGLALAVGRRSALPPLRYGALLCIWPATMLAAMVAVYSLVTESKVGYDNARLVYPALPALATLAAWGWAGLTAPLPRPPRRALGALALAVGALVAGLLPWAYLRPRYPAPWPVSDQPPASATAVAAAPFGHAVALAAIALPSRSFAAGTGAFLTFHWRVSGPVPPGEWLFVHVEDARGHIAAAFDGAPNSDTLPLASWRPGDVVEEREVLTFHRDATPGAYTLWVGWYDPRTGARLPLPSGATQLPAADLQIVEPAKP